jgi:hypothetical protein
MLGGARWHPRQSEFMSRFGQTLFGGSPFIRWTLTPCVLLFALSMPLLMEERTPAKVALLVGVELVCLTYLAGLWLPPRLGHWAFRGLAGLIFLAYAAYAVDVSFFKGKRAATSARRGAASPLNAWLGFAVIGLPALWFALKGRLTIRSEPTDEQLAAERQAFEERLLRPDWEFYARHLQRPVPAALRAPYAAPALLTSGGFAYRDGVTIGTFVPIGEDALLDQCDPASGAVVAIAVTNCGDAIYLRPGPAEADTVYVTFHDSGDTAVLAESVDAFVTRVRELHRDA